jgi:hypothetical protein
MGDGGWNLSWKNDKVLKLRDIIFLKYIFFPRLRLSLTCLAAQDCPVPAGEKGKGGADLSLLAFGVRTFREANQVRDGPKSAEMADENH